MKQENLSFNVLIAAAGSGARMDSDTPKQYLKIAGKPVLRHTIEAFLKCEGLNQLRVIIDPSHADLYHDAVSGLALPPPIHGSTTRQLSIFNGLKELSNLKNEDIILIHDAARALIAPENIEALAQAVQTDNAATLAIPVNDTMRYENSDAYAERESLWALQTPQGFKYDLIMDAHKNANPDVNYTDDTAILSAMSGAPPIKFVQGRKTNFKITTGDDLDMAEKLMSKPADIRTGQGFDVHAFDTEKSGSVRLCGIDIPHNHPLKGHSDADVALHTITDAILGAIGEGDIGRHFPPSDDTFRNMDSAIFLQKAIELTQSKGASINNIDLTIICEAPKITPHADAMKQRLSEITNLDPARINIKATTTEQLGFTGRGEGIAAQAVATVNFP